MKVRNKMIHFRSDDYVDRKLDNLCSEIGRDNRSWLLNCLVTYIYDNPKRRKDFVETMKKMLPYI